MTGPFRKLVQSASQLRAILPKPEAISVAKVIDHLDRHVRSFVALCPYVVISSADRHGRCDASPRGGEPGFVRVIDDKHLLIPEATGNRRADSIENILENPGIGLLLLIPGYEETLRINGRAFVTDDSDLLGGDSLSNGKAPLLGIGVEVQECFLHCAKATIRSSIWNPMGWPDVEDLPTAAEVLKDHTSAKINGGTVGDFQQLLDDSYTHRL